MRGAVPCSEGPDVWFADSQVVTEIAKRLCWFHCRFRIECLAQAVGRPEHGVWGGYTEQEREHLRRGLPVNPRPMQEVVAR